MRNVVLLGCAVAQVFWAFSLRLAIGLAVALWAMTGSGAQATPFTTVSPDGTVLPSAYPEAGGVALILYGANGNIYYQFSEPDGAFVGFQQNRNPQGQPARFRGNPFTINDPLILECGIQSCPEYFGNEIVKMEVRFTALDGDTHAQGFDFNDISLLINGVNIGNWSTVPTQNTSRDGTVLISSQTGFGQNTFDTGWFSTTNPALLADILASESITTQVFDDDPDDNFWNFRLGNNLTNPGLAKVAPAYTLAKRARSGSFTGPEITTFSAVGETIFYTYDVRNVGSVRIDNLAVDDDRLGAVTCAPTSINVGETAVCQASHQVTQPEFDAQVITNVATATGDPEFGQLGTLSDTVTLTGPGRNPAMTLEKTPEGGTYATDGQRIPYRFVVRNTGDVTLRNVSVTDPLIPTLTCTQASLAPGAALTCTADYFVDQDDLDTGSIVNTASASAIDPTGAGQNASDTATNTAQQTVGWAVTKTTTSTPLNAGDTLDYRFALRNTGNVSISAITVTDAKCATPISFVSGDSDGDSALDPTEVHVYTCTSQPITQTEVDAGEVENTVSVTGTPANGANLPPATDTLETPVVRSSGFNVVKSTTTVPTQAGDTLDYLFVVTNTGNASIGNVSITDPKCAAAPVLQSGDADNDTRLGGNETWEYTCTSVPVTQPQADAGSVDNTVTLSGQDFDGQTVTGSDTLATPLAAAPAFNIVKSTTSTPTRAGETLVYNFAVENTGNVSIRDVVVMDGKCASGITLTGGDSDGDTVLDVGDTHLYRCTSVPVTQPEVDAGQVTNTATVDGAPVRGTLPQDSANNVTPIAPAPALALDKRLRANSPTRYSSTSDVILFDFVVTNTGNITITTPISITDAMLDAPASCPSVGAGLAPGASLTCTGQHSVDQGDLDAGSVVNTATANTTGAASDPDTVTVPADQNPSLSLVKTAMDPPSFAVGQMVSYTYVVTNNGNVTVPDTATISVADNRTSVICPAVPNGGLAPTQSLTCNATYAVQFEDLQLGSITNTATATDGNVTSPTAAATVPANVAPALSLTKTADALPADFEEAGDVITYTYVVQNTGGAGFTETIQVADNKINNGVPFDCWVPANATDTFDPDPNYPGGMPPTNINGQTQTCQASYTVTQEDIDAGFVTNEAVAQTIFAPTGAAIPVASAPVTETVNFALPAQLSVAKAATPTDLTPAAPGDLITYTFTLTNTGEVTLDDVVPVDAGPTFGGQAGTGTLSAFTVTAGPDANTDGRIDTLAPDAVGTVTLTYALTQADIDNAAAATDPATGIANTATATAAPRNGTLQTVAPSAATTGFTPQPMIVASKSTFSAPTEEGDTLEYTFFAENTGNVSISAVTVTDAKCAATPVFQSGDLDNDNILDVGETWTYGCTSIAVTQAEVDAGEVENTVAINGTPTGGTLAEATASVTTPIPADGALDLVKSTASVPVRAGDTLDYLFTVTNTGNVSITPVAITDPKCAAAPTLRSGDANNDNAVNPTETWEYVCTSIPVTQAEVNAAMVSNTAEISGTTPAGDPITPPSDTVDTPVAAAPAFAVVKSTSDVPAVANQTIDYTFRVTNSGNVSLSNLVVTDAKCASGPVRVSGDANGNAALDPPEVFIYECTSVPVTQAELDSGSVDNTVRVNATLPDGTAVPQISDTLSTPVNPQPSWTLAKTTVSVPAQAGDTLTYDFVLTNTGNVSVTSVAIADGKCAAAPVLNAATDVGADGRLAPAEVWEYSCTSIAVTQAEVDAGEVINSASAGGTPSGGTLANAPAGNTTAIASTPALAMTKGTSSAPQRAGDTLVYEFTVTNPGNTSLSSVMITDAKCATTPALQSGDANGDGALNPTESWGYTCTSVPVTQAEVDAGQVDNTASVAAEDPFGGTATPATASDSTAIPEAGGFSVVKSTASAPTRAGETLDYRFTLANTGNVSVRNIALTDAKCAAAPALISGDANADGALNPTETFVYGCTSVPVTQAEVDAGVINNAVSVAGQTPAGTDLTPATDTHSVGVLSSPALEVVKTVATTGLEPLDTVTFTIAVTNTGNVTLTGLALEDTFTRADGTVLTFGTPVSFVSADQGSGLGRLLPDEVATYRATYDLTQADIDAGGLANTATATANPPTGLAVSDVSDDGVPGNGDDTPTVLEIAPEPALALVKELEAVVKADGSSVASYDAVGDRLDYLFTVTNTGNITITDPVTIADPLITDAGGTITCPAGALAPDAMVECRGSYSVTLADLDAGSVANTATASDGNVTSDPSDVTVGAVQTPAIATTKSARPLPPASFVVGAVATYDYVTTNTGNVTILDAITIEDSLIPAANINCAPWPGRLEPGQSYACVGTYVVTSDDVDLGVVTNLARGVSGDLVSPQVAVSIPDASVPALSVVKSSPDTSFAAVGDVLNYEFEVMNAGERAFVQPIEVVDNRIGTLQCWVATATDPDFTSGERATCDAPYTVTQADLDAGFVTNEVFAQTIFGSGTEVVSGPDTVTINADTAPALELVKSVALPTGRSSETLIAGDVLTYTLTVENTGNQTLRNITLADPMLGLNCAVPVLAPDAVNSSCTGTLTLTQDQIDAGNVTNTASASGSDPRGNPVRDTDTLITPMPTGRPAMTLVKSANIDPFGPVGSTIVYGFAVENTGNITLRNIAVTDPRVPGYSCTIARLLPGRVNDACSVPYEVTQDDVDAGRITNTATASGVDATGDPINATGQITTQGPANAGALDVVKTQSATGATAGAQVNFTIRVRNTGNVTLRDVTPVDTLTRLNTDPLALDAPGVQFVSGDTNNDNALNVDEVWTYAATYTLNQDDVNVGGVSNTVTVTATQPDGGIVSDVSDDGNDTDGNTTDDPTIFEVPFGPAIEAVKTVSTPASVAGETIVFDITVRNVGNVDVQPLAINDTLTRVDGTVLQLTTQPTLVSGDTTQAGTLNLTETWLYQASYVLTQADIDAGGVRNVVNVTMADTRGIIVSDQADNGDDADGDTLGDPTTLLVPPMPAVEVRKIATSEPAAVGDLATFRIDVENTGNVTLSGLALADTLTRADGTALALDGAPEFSTATAGSTAAAILPEGIVSYIARYTIVQEDIDAGGIVNTATATVTTPRGTILTDISDDPVNPATGPSDPTQLALEQLPSLVITKGVTGGRSLFPTVFEVTFEITVENDGNTTLTDLSVLDDLVAYAAPAQIESVDFPTTSAVTGLTSGIGNAGFDGVADTQLMGAGATLTPGATARITVTTVYDASAGFPAPGENTATATTAELTDPIVATTIATNIDSDGDGVPDGQESPTADRDNDGIVDSQDYDPTGYFYCEDSGRILSGGQITVTGNGASQTGVGTTGSIRIVRDGADGSYQFHVTRPGTYTMSYRAPDNTPSDTLLATTTPVDVTTLRDVLTGTTDTNPRILGSSEFANRGALSDFSPQANPAFYTTFVIEAGDPAVFSNNIPFQCNPVGDLSAVKTVTGPTDVRIGDAVSYQLSYELAAGAADLRDLTFTDLLPVGISYVPGSAFIARDGGTPVALEPVVAGRSLKWTGQMMTQGSRASITFTGRVAPNAPVGNLENRTYGEGPTGQILSNIASAIVRRVPEHVFDCSDVIGKVFDDRNRNGYQDGPGGADITNQDYLGGKGKYTKAPPTGEPGLAGVRIATANGTLITTDAFGRFHVPCAALPEKSGTNFLLKVDERSLPSGYRLTTENPRVTRLTAGKFAKMNFGAALGRVIDINISGRAFERQADPSAKLRDAVHNLAKVLRKEPSVVRLAYVADTNAEVTLGRARLRAVEKLLRAEWRRNGTYKLTIEKTIQKRQ